MTGYDELCPPLECGDGCAPLPAGFARLRYYFGKRLGVADLVDEQLYHVAKLRLHARHLHGAGVVCGLGVGPFAGSTTVLRVRRGAALDRCGREIVVGQDQCIDLEAWLAANPPDPAPPVGTPLELAVALRYAECGSTPEPAPRNACSCDAGGTEFGRVREGFLLEVIDGLDAAGYRDPGRFPTAAEVAHDLAFACSARVLAGGIAARVTSGCGAVAEDDAIVLARFRVRLDAGGHVATLEVDAPTPPLLAPTSLLQDLLGRLLAAEYEPAALVEGPTVIATRFEKQAARAILTLSLSAPVIAKTVETARFAVSRLDDATGWALLPAASLAAAFDAGAKAIVVTVSTPGFFVAGGKYRLALVPDPAQPICDGDMRRLVPVHFAWDFVVGAGDAATAAPYAA